MISDFKLYPSSFCRDVWSHLLVENWTYGPFLVRKTSTSNKCIHLKFFLSLFSEMYIVKWYAYMYIKWLKSLICQLNTTRFAYNLFRCMVYMYCNRVLKCDVTKSLFLEFWKFGSSIMWNSFQNYIKWMQNHLCMLNINWDITI